jgi:hypothetical protein
VTESAEEPREHFAQVGESVIRRLVCADCLRLYAFLDHRQMQSTWAVRGIADAADALSWQHRTAKKHARHLAAAGLIDLDPRPTRAWGSTRIRVLHQPARRRSAQTVSVPAVWLDQPIARWRPTNNLDSLNAWRDAPSVGPDDPHNEERDAPSVCDGSGEPCGNCGEMVFDRRGLLGVWCETCTEEY